MSEDIDTTGQTALNPTAGSSTKPSGSQSPRAMTPTTFTLVGVIVFVSFALLSSLGEGLATIGLMVWPDSELLAVMTERSNDAYSVHAVTVAVLVLGGFIDMVRWTFRLIRRHMRALLPH